MWLQIASLLVAVATVCGQNVEEWRTVRIAQGPLRGRYEPQNGVYAFRDIPYATAPTGTDRFKAPRPPPTWLTTFDAVDRGIVCPQIGAFLNMREDCLVASVYVPPTAGTNLPVVVSIHGGAHQTGFGNTETLNTLVRTNRVIAVTFNHRLGVHGYLCLGTEDAPGNAGSKDQVALLRWVKQNIASFGGNPEDVTLMGCSAGGGATDVLTLSKLTNGLINKAIIGSGASSGAVGVQINPVENAKTYASLLNFQDVDNITALGEFYKTASFELLLERFDAILNNEDSAVLFSPCIERDIGQERILEDAPINIITSGEYTSIPLLYGFSNMEGLWRVPMFDTWKNAMNEKFSDFLPAELGFESENEKEDVASRVKQFYFGSQAVGEQTILSYIDYFTDQMFGYPMLRALTHRINTLNDIIYLYEYSFVDENTPSIPYTDVLGANHCQQNVAVLDTNNSNMTEAHIDMRNTMQEIYLNFIVTGNPVGAGSQLPSWPAANAAKSPHMSLGPTIELKGALLADRTAFWDGIYDMYYRAPQPPSFEDTAGSAISFSISNILLFINLVVFYLVY